MIRQSMVAELTVWLWQQHGPFDIGSIFDHLILVTIFVDFLHLEPFHPGSCGILIINTHVRTDVYKCLLPCSVTKSTCDLQIK